MRRSRRRLECPDDSRCALGQAPRRSQPRAETPRSPARSPGSSASSSTRGSHARRGRGRVPARARARSGERPTPTSRSYQLYSMRERFGRAARAASSRKRRARSTSRRASASSTRLATLDEGVVGDADARCATTSSSSSSIRARERAFQRARRLYSAGRAVARARRAPRKRMAYAPAGRRGRPGRSIRARTQVRRGELSATGSTGRSRAADLFEEALAEEPARSAREGARGADEAARAPACGSRARSSRSTRRRGLAASWRSSLGAQREAAEGQRGGRAARRDGRAAGGAASGARSSRSPPGARRCGSTRAGALRGSRRAAGDRCSVGCPNWRPAWEEAIRPATRRRSALRGELLEKVAKLYEYELARSIARAAPGGGCSISIPPTCTPRGRRRRRWRACTRTQESWPELIEVLRRQADWADRCRREEGAARSASAASRRS